MELVDGLIAKYTARDLCSEYGCDALVVGILLRFRVSLAPRSTMSPPLTAAYPTGDTGDTDDDDDRDLIDPSITLKTLIRRMRDLRILSLCEEINTAMCVNSSDLWVEVESCHGLENVFRVAVRGVEEDVLPGAKFWGGDR